MRYVQKLCAATVPALHWNTLFQLLFALSCEDWLTCLRRCASLSFIRPQTASYLAVYRFENLPSFLSARKQPCFASSSGIVPPFSKSRLFVQDA